MFSKEVYVVFKRAQSMGFIRRFLHPEMSHCFVMWPDNDKIIVFDQAVNHTSIFTVDDHSDIIGKSIAVKVKVTTQHGSLFGLNTCVSSVKRLIGLKCMFILTPYQLYKRLK